MSEAISTASGVNSRTYNQLAVKLESIKKEQGVLGSVWNGFKEFTGLGQSYTKCESMLEKYKNGEVDITQAMDYINDYQNKQDNMVELQKNLIAGTAAIAASVATGGAATTLAGLAAILGSGAATGAVVKTGLGAIDRATNEVDNDVLDTEEIAKDAISGSITGATSAIPSDPFNIFTKGIKNEAAKKVATQAVCSVACGAVSGSTSYLTDVAMDEDKEFDFGSLTASTVSSAAVSGVVGAALGGFKVTGIGKSVESSLKSLGKTECQSKIITDATSSATRKIGGREVNNLKEALNAA